MFESPKRHQFSLEKSGTLQIPNSFARTSDSAGEAGGKQEKKHHKQNRKLGTFDQHMTLSQTARLSDVIGEVIFTCLVNLQNATRRNSKLSEPVFRLLQLN